MTSQGRGGTAPSADVNTKGFERYYRTIREHIRLIVACTVLTLAVAAIYVKTAPRSYTATADLLVNPASQSDTVLFTLPVLHASGNPTQDVLTAAGLVTTPEVANATISALHLKATASTLLGQVQAVPLAQSNIIALQAVAPSALRAQKVANTFAAETIAIRTAALHQAIAVLIPKLSASVAALPASERNGAGSLGDELNQLEQLQLTSDPTLAVAVQAELPTGPSSPRTSLALAAGLFAGLLIGVGAAFGFDALDPRVRREEQLLERFGEIPVLARVPRVVTDRDRKPGPLIPAELSAAASEQYRTLRATLATRAVGMPQAYLLTGSAPSEGKTTIAIGLAAALAQGGGRVILIEADLRRPTIASALGMVDYSGIEQVLIGEVELSDALVAIQFGGTTVDVLAAHTHSAAVVERLSFAASQRLVVEAKKLADFVVFDSPPLTAVIDALPLAHIVDEVVIVVRVEHTRFNKLFELCTLLSHQGTIPSGFVLVGVTQNVGYYYQDDAEPLDRVKAHASSRTG
jgi:capsular exopolysaccharide synthesis family protein